MKCLLSIISLAIFSAALSAQSPDIMWTKTFVGSDEEVGQSIQQTNDGGYLITGTTEPFGAGNEDVWLIKPDANGETLWTKTFGGSSGDVGNSIQQTSDDGYIITASTESFGAGSSDVSVIKVAPSITSIDENPYTYINGYQLHQNYPNPLIQTQMSRFQLLDRIFTTLKIYNIHGQEVTTLLSRELKAGNYNHPWNAGLFVQRCVYL